MEQRSRGSASVSGAGKISGGVYQKVTISGAGRITGDVEADHVSIAGAGKVEGSVKAGTFKAAGSCRVTGSVEAEEIKASGSFKVAGDVRAERFNVSGSQKLEGNLHAESARLAGSFKIDGDVEAERVEASGAINVGGLLNADQVTIHLHGRSQVREIGGSKIVVTQGGSGSVVFGIAFAGRAGRLQVETVEGDDVSLEATSADTVRGKRVVIGPGCEIGTVEYAESLQVDEEAKVDKAVQVGADHETGPPGEQAAAPPTAPPPSAPEAGPGPSTMAKVTRRDRRRRMEVVFFGRSVRNPILRGLLAVAGVAIALAVAAFVLLLVLPLVGTLVAAVLAGVAVLVAAVMVYVLVRVVIALVGSLFSGFHRSC